MGLRISPAWGGLLCGRARSRLPSRLRRAERTVQDARVAEIGAALMARLDALARFTDEPGRLTRFYLAPAHRAAADKLRGWMEEAGLTSEIDAIGNVVGRAGVVSDRP